MRNRRIIHAASAFFLMALAFTGGVTGCGYSLRTSDSALLAKENIRSIYVAPLENNTFKAGVENLMYNIMVRELAAHMNVRLVRRPEEADAQLFGAVETAAYAVSSTVPADQLEPRGTGPRNVLVASVYSASLGVRFRLERNKRTLWASSFSGAKTFPASNRLGVQGTTSALINDSEFDRALEDLARRVSTDARESMLSGF